MELTIGLFHLVVLCIENDGLLDLFDALLIQFVVTNAEFPNGEVVPQSIFDSVSTYLRDATVENLKLKDCVIVCKQLRDGKGSSVLKLAVPQIEILEELVIKEVLAELLYLRTIYFAVRNVDRLQVDI